MMRLVRVRLSKSVNSNKSERRLVHFVPLYYTVTITIAALVIELRGEKKKKTKLIFILVPARERYFCRAQRFT